MPKLSIIFLLIPEADVSLQDLKLAKFLSLLEKKHKITDLKLDIKGKFYLEMEIKLQKKI